MQSKKPASLSELPTLQSAVGRTLIIYDGECPFCSRFVVMQRLKASIGPVALMNARDGGVFIEALAKLGYDLDQGMVLIWNDQVYHGEECVHRLALLSSGSGLFNRINAFVFRNPRVSALLYPMMRFGRNLTLRILGRRKLMPAYK